MDENYIDLDRRFREFNTEDYLEDPYSSLLGFEYGESWDQLLKGIKGDGHDFMRFPKLVKWNQNRYAAKSTSRCAGFFAPHHLPGY